MEKSDSCFIATEKCPLLFILLFSYVYFSSEKRFYRDTGLSIINSVLSQFTLIMVRDQARIVCSCFMAALLPQIKNIYHDMFQWRWFRRSIDVIFYCFCEKSPASVTKVPAAGCYFEPCFDILASGQCDLQCKIKETLWIHDFWNPL